MAVQGARPGFVFCARVGDHPRVQFRYVDITDPSSPEVIDDTLACLANARPPDGFATPRVLDDKAHMAAFDAWKVAKAHIVAQWNFAADPANLTPSVPKTMHDAAQLVRDNPPEEMTIQEQDWLISSLQAPYPERVQNRVRRILAGDQAPVEKVRSLAELAAEEGMRPLPDPEPLPEITEEDVHLVCWLSVVPQGQSGHSEPEIAT